MIAMRNREKLGNDTPKKPVYNPRSSMVCMKSEPHAAKEMIEDTITADQEHSFEKQ